jgi:hypothetical protein
MLAIRVAIAKLRALVTIRERLFDWSLHPRPAGHRPRVGARPVSERAPSGVTGMGTRTPGRRSVRGATAAGATRAEQRHEGHDIDTPRGAHHETPRRPARAVICRSFVKANVRVMAGGSGPTHSGSSCD